VSLGGRPLSGKTHPGGGRKVMFEITEQNPHLVACEDEGALLAG